MDIETIEEKPESAQDGEVTPAPTAKKQRKKESEKAKRRLSWKLSLRR